MMTASVAQSVMGSDLRMATAVGLIGLYCLVSAHQTYRHIIGGDPRRIGTRLRERAKLCLDRTGFVGAVLARHTVLVTLNVLVLNLSLNLIAVIDTMDTRSMMANLLETSLSVLAGVCIALIIVIAVTTFALCNEVVNLAEGGHRRGD